MHNHSHGAGHSHDHDHHKTKMSFEEQLITLLNHWVNHNDSHAGTYRDWAKKAAENNMPSKASLLEEIAGMTDKISEKMREAASDV